MLQRANSGVNTAVAETGGSQFNFHGLLQDGKFEARSFVEFRGIKGHFEPEIFQQTKDPADGSYIIRTSKAGFILSSVVKSKDEPLSFP